MSISLEALKKLNLTAEQLRMIQSDVQASSAQLDDVSDMETKLGQILSANTGLSRFSTDPTNKAACFFKRPPEAMPVAGGSPSGRRASLGSVMRGLARVRSAENLRQFDENDPDDLASWSVSGRDTASPGRSPMGAGLRRTLSAEALGSPNCSTVSQSHSSTPSNLPFSGIHHRMGTPPLGIIRKESPLYRGIYSPTASGPASPHPAAGMYSPTQSLTSVAGRSALSSYQSEDDAESTSSSVASSVDSARLELIRQRMAKAANAFGDHVVATTIATERPVYQPSVYGLAAPRPQNYAALPQASLGVPTLSLGQAAPKPKPALLSQPVVLGGPQPPAAKPTLGLGTGTGTGQRTSFSGPGASFRKSSMAASRTSAPPHDEVAPRCRQPTLVQSEIKPQPRLSYMEPPTSPTVSSSSSSTSASQYSLSAASSPRMDRAAAAVFAPQVVRMEATPALLPPRPPQSPTESQCSLSSNSQFYSSAASSPAVDRAAAAMYAPQVVRLPAAPSAQSSDSDSDSSRSPQPSTSSYYGSSAASSPQQPLAAAAHSRQAFFTPAQQRPPTMAMHALQPVKATPPPKPAGQRPMQHNRPILAPLPSRPMAAYSPPSEASEADFPSQCDYAESPVRTESPMEDLRLRIQAIPDFGPIVQPVASATASEVDSFLEVAKGRRLSLVAALRQEPPPVDQQQLSSAYASEMSTPRTLLSEPAPRPEDSRIREAAAMYQDQVVVHTGIEAPAVQRRGKASAIDLMDLVIELGIPDPATAIAVANDDPYGSLAELGLAGDHAMLTSPGPLSEISEAVQSEPAYLPTMRPKSPLGQQDPVEAALFGPETLHPAKRSREDLLDLEAEFVETPRSHSQMPLQMFPQYPATQMPYQMPPPAQYGSPGLHQLPSMMSMASMAPGSGPYASQSFMTMPYGSTSTAQLTMMGSCGTMAEELRASRIFPSSTTPSSSSLVEDPATGRLLPGRPDISPRDGLLYLNYRNCMRSPGTRLPLSFTEVKTLIVEEHGMDIAFREEPGTPDQKSLFLMPLNGLTVPRWVPVNTRFRIGRGGNWMLAASRVVSRNHCEVFHDVHSYFVRDVGSRSGTFINGTRLETGGAPRELKHGDIFQIGVDLATEADPLGRVPDQFRCIQVMVLYGYKARLEVPQEQELREMRAQRADGQVNGRTISISSSKLERMARKARAQKGKLASANTRLYVEFGDLLGESAAGTAILLRSSTGSNEDGPNYSFVFNNYRLTWDISMTCEADGRVLILTALPGADAVYQVSTGREGGRLVATITQQGDHRVLVEPLGRAAENRLIDDRPADVLGVVEVPSSIAAVGGWRTGLATTPSSAAQASSVLFSVPSATPLSSPSLGSPSSLASGTSSVDPGTPFYSLTGDLGTAGGSLAFYIRRWTGSRAQQFLGEAQLTARKASWGGRRTAFYEARLPAVQPAEDDELLAMASLLNLLLQLDRRRR